jgi:hypothetical protein
VSISGAHRGVEHRTGGKEPEGFPHGGRSRPGRRAGNDWRRPRLLRSRWPPAGRSAPRPTVAARRGLWRGSDHTLVKSRGHHQLGSCRQWNDRFSTCLMAIRMSPNRPRRRRSVSYRDDARCEPGLIGCPSPLACSQHLSFRSAAGDRLITTGHRCQCTSAIDAPDLSGSPLS